jgi:hypothetical protein
MPKHLFRNVFITMALLIFGMPHGNADDFIPINLLALRTAGTIEGLGKFNYDNRLAYYESIDRLANRLLESSTSVPVKEIKGSSFGEKYPRLVFVDRDGDGFPEFWIYLQAGGTDSREFGFVFDMNSDGHADYVIFNGGLEITKGDLSSGFRMIWRNYHWLDSNYDGKTDVEVVNSIGLKKDQFVDEGVSAWLYDIDFDGLFDHGEYLGPDVNRRIDRHNGNFYVQYAWLSRKEFQADRPRTIEKMIAEVKAGYDSIVGAMPSGRLRQELSPHPR